MKKNETIMTEASLAKLYGPHCISILYEEKFIELLPRKRKERRKFKIIRLDLPKLEEYQKMLRKKYTYLLESIFEGAKGDIEELQSEMEDWASNMEGSNLSATDKCSQVREAADSLSAINWPELDDWPNVNILSLPDLSHRTGRAHRAGVAAGELELVAQIITDYIKIHKKDLLIDDAKVSELEEFVESCESAASDIECVEFPGMF